ncbi:MAG: MFS transporter, partial [Clostridia bacterium]|nr:MFS transporter [Clostridia bacterium]
EYLVYILVNGSFLATLTTELGMSDSLTGILSSFVSLGCLFQLISVALRPRRIRLFVTVFNLINQVLFTLLYVFPFSPLQQELRIGLFIGTVLLSYFFFYVAAPKKTNWFMSKIDDRTRGRFTANKEIVSLIAGMAFSFGMGTLVDHFKAQNDMRTAFIICAVTIIGLSLIQAALSLGVTEQENIPTDKVNPLKIFAELLKDQNVVKVTILFAVWNIAQYAAVPFYSTYLIKELGFSLQLVSILSIVGSIARILVSRFWGSYADKHSFAAMVKLCYAVAAVAYLAMVFAVPATGLVAYLIYIVAHSVAMGGINSSLMNLVFDYAPTEKRADALALNQTVGGIVGFVTTLVFSTLVTYVQTSGNTLFGMPVYAQQITSVVALAGTIICMLYVQFALLKKGEKN